MNETIIGIDLGTTNSAVAYVNNGHPEIINVDGKPTLPSCVGVAPDGKILVGQEAMRQYTVYPERTVRSIKRSMGLDIPVVLGDQSFSPEEISAFILKKLKSTAETALGRSITKAVITVPAYFNEGQRAATRNAGEMAGLEVVRILNEPTAAALAYGSNRQQTECVLVYDLGGGTFDASLVISQDSVIEVRSSHGDTQLGGDDFDEILVRKAATHFVDQGGKDPIQNPPAHNRLKLLMEQAKIRLSDHPFASIEEAFFHDNRNLQFEIERPDYEQDIRVLLDKTIGCCAQCLHDANITASALDHILLVGGSSRTPLVHELIEKRFGLTPRYEIDPDLIVAYGAALQAAAIAGIEGTAILVDITPYNLGIKALEGTYFQPFFSTIIPRNSPLPVSKSQSYMTTFDGQPKVQIEVWQGAHNTLEENQCIGEFIVDGLDKNAPEASKIIVHFQLNLNGMLEVTATEKASGLSKSVQIDTSKSNVIDIEGSRNRVNTMSDDVDDNNVSTSPLAPEIQNTNTLIEKANKLLDSINPDPEDRTEIEEIISKMRESIQTEDLDKLNELNDQLSDILFYLES